MANQQMHLQNLPHEKKSGPMVSKPGPTTKTKTAKSSTHANITWCIGAQFNQMKQYAWKLTCVPCHLKLWCQLIDNPEYWIVVNALDSC